jgi:hypothetical protein
MVRFSLTFVVAATILSAGLVPSAWADKVIMKDGTVYKGKILIDTDKSLLIGNPPFDPNSYLLQTEDIDTIVYEEYTPNAPSERKRGLVLDLKLTGQTFSSDQLDLSPAPGLYGGLGFRVHPILEISGGVHWHPALSSGSGLLVSDGTTTRSYEKFWDYAPIFNLRLYPLFRKKWKVEPFLYGGYGWNRLFPKSSGDRLSGSGWSTGAGVLYNLTRHLFVEGRLGYARTSYDKIQFLGREGTIRPEIDFNSIQLDAGLSYRL